MIITIIVGFICFVVGGCCGFVMMALMVAASREDQRREREADDIRIHES